KSAMRRVDRALRARSRYETGRSRPRDGAHGPPSIWANFATKTRAIHLHFTVSVLVIFDGDATDWQHDEELLVPRGHGVFGVCFAGATDHRLQQRSGRNRRFPAADGLCSVESQYGDLVGQRSSWRRLHLWDSFDGGTL